VLDKRISFTGLLYSLLRTPSKSKRTGTWPVLGIRAPRERGWTLFNYIYNPTSGRLEYPVHLAIARHVASYQYGETGRKKRGLAKEDGKMLSSLVVEAH
jgi:hypothetical protein